MSSLVWDENFSVRVADMDDQHKQLFSFINELNEAFLKGKGRNVMDDILNGLLVYTESHFSDEERLMAKYSYPDIMRHIGEHEVFARKVKEFQRDFRAGNVFISAQVLYLLKDWLKNHILVSDKKYGVFIAGKTS